MKRVIFAVITIFITYFLLDFVIHSVILKSVYEETSSLWRPEGEMKLVVMYIAVLISIIAYVLIYHRFFEKKNMTTAFTYGFLFGLTAGMSMGYGMYAVLPIPYKLAAVWCWGSVAEVTIGSVWLGVFLKS